MKAKNKQSGGAERRRSPRTNVLDSFNLYLVLPNLFGMAKVSLRDISSVGLSVRTEIEANVKQGDSISARLYFNPAFYLPIEAIVVRASAHEVALEFQQIESDAAHAIAALQSFLDAATKAGVMVE